MIRQIINIYSDVGFWGLIKRSVKKIRRELIILMHQIRDFLFTTYSKDCAFKVKEQEFHVNPATLLEGCIPKAVLNNYLNHKFNLLGSGWVGVNYGIQCKGLENHKYEKKIPPNIDRNGLWLKGRINSSNLAESMEVWKLIDETYKPIDWQIDFKSGFRWSENTYSKRIQFGYLPGVDVKVPWELARMQHLPQLALACAVYNLTEFEKSNVNKEFRNQILDFISTNPPRYGVNWVCAMDVAIRAANWVLAIEIFHSLGRSFDQEFYRIFQRSVYEHGKFIFENLEWNDGKRGNHYLSNICGLVFISSYLPPTKICNAWLAFSIKELKREVDFQFLADGGNFEFSTAYHRLSTEMILYSTARIIGLSDYRIRQLQKYKPRIFLYAQGRFISRKTQLKLHSYTDKEGLEHRILFSRSYFQKLKAFIDFLINISKHGNVLPQIGDNDSGRFFKLNPKFKELLPFQTEKVYSDSPYKFRNDPDEILYQEDHLDCTSLFIAASALFGKRILPKYCIEHSSDYSMIKALLSKRHNLNFESTKAQALQISPFESSEAVFNNYVNKAKQIPDSKKLSNCYDLIEKPINLQLYSYPDFGLYVFKENDFYLSVRCYTRFFPHSPAGHMHDDQFGIELSINNIDLIRDPGSYIYTPLPWQRNLYRSSDSHYSPFYDLNCNLDDPNVFKQIKVFPAEIKYFGHRGMIAECKSAHQTCGLVVEFVNNILNISFLYFAGGKKHLKGIPFSPGYGLIQS
jgi:hypothetical protein